MNLTKAINETMKKRILIVDDDMLIRHLLKFKLSQKGFDVSTAKNEKEFWDGAFNKKPDIILLDLWLHDKMGTDIYDRLVEFGFDSNVPVIFITGHIQVASTKPIRVKKKQVFLSKPFDFDELMNVITHLLKTSFEQTGLSAQGGYDAVSRPRNARFSTRSFDSRLLQ